MHKCYPLGDAAIVIQFGNVIDLSVNLKIRAICNWLDEYTFHGFVEYVPAYTTITIYYEPWILRYEELKEMVDEMLQEVTDLDAETGDLVEIPVCYGGKYGADLEFVAKYHAITEDEVIALHTAPEYLVYMIGFTPGFPYLGGLDARIATPRKDSPRARVEAGAVGIAGEQTGVYPLATPGGWQIIGQTALALFNIDEEKPALLSAGDRVKFKAVTEAEFLGFNDDLEWELG